MRIASRYWQGAPHKAWLNEYAVRLQNETDLAVNAPLGPGVAAEPSLELYLTSPRICQNWRLMIRSKR